MNQEFKGEDRREFHRLDHKVPLVYKVCSEQTISKLMHGYTSNVSQVGILCRLNEKVDIDCILWLVFDRDTLDICKELEANSLVHQRGILGKVVRIEDEVDGAYDVGIRFLTRKEKTLEEIDKIIS